MNAVHSTSSPRLGANAVQRCIAADCGEPFAITERIYVCPKCGGHSPYLNSKYALYPKPAPSSDPTTTSLTKCMLRTTREMAMLKDNASKGACSSG